MIINNEEPLQLINMTHMAYPLEEVIKGTFKKCYKMNNIWNITKNNKMHKIKLNDVKHWIYHTPWSYECNGKEHFLSIYQVLLLPSKYKQHMDRIKKTNLKYPIVVMKDKYDKNGIILDGNHRFAKAILQNKANILVKYITDKQLKKIEQDCS